MSEMNPHDVWSAFVGHEYGPSMRISLAMLLIVPAGAMREGVEKLERERALGPLLNPTAYLDGRRFINAEEYIRVLTAAAKLRDELGMVMERGFAEIETAKAKCAHEKPAGVEGGGEPSTGITAGS